MGKFFRENKIFLAIIIAALIIGGAIFFSGGKTKTEISGEKKQIFSEVNKKKDCSNIPELPDLSSKLATKIIDGDTFLISGGYSVRILGMDADERGYPCYQPAKEELEKLILNKKVKLERKEEDKDQWCRYLRYVFIGDKNVGVELIKEGLAVTRFSPEDIKYREEAAEAEKNAEENKIGCKWNKKEIKKEEKINFQWEKLTAELTGLRVVPACQSGNYSGKEIIIEGKISTAFKSQSNNIFLNFEKPYPNQCFAAVIFSSDLYKFTEDPEGYYSNKTVRIKGEIKDYKGKPEIILKNASQIEIGK